MADLSHGPAPASQDGPPRDAQSLHLLDDMQANIIDRSFVDTGALRSLYMLDAPTKVNRFLRNLTRVAEPAVRCQIERDGTLLPHQGAGPHEAHYRLLITFNKLLIAPTIRLECTFLSSSNLNDPPYLTLVLEFHFCDFGKDGRRITSYAQADGELSFTSFGATSSGFNNIGSAEHRFGPKEREIVSLLKQYLEFGPARGVVLKLHHNPRKPQELRDVQDIRALLPGGDKTLLPTIEANKEFEAVRKGFIDLRRYGGALLAPTMVPLDCNDTFSTVDEACLQLARSALVADAEESQAEHLWATVEHEARLYHCGAMFVLAVNFKHHRTLGNDKSKPKLQKSLQVKVVSGMPASLVGQEGRRLDENPGLPHHDAFFRITPPKALRDYILNAAQELPFQVRLAPHVNKFAIRAKMATVSELRGAEQWHEILLNQHTTTWKPWDATAEAGEDHVALDHLLRTAKPWNAEQLQVIDGVVSGKSDKLSVVLGIAGTGKTTLHKALALYYWSLGYHVLSLAPSNQDADHVASQLTPDELHREFPSWDLHGFEGQFMRLFSGSKDISIEQMTEQQAKINRVGHEGGGIAAFNELLIAVEEEQKVTGTVREYGMLQTLIRTADDGGLPNQSLEMGQQWAQLKQLIAAHRRGEQTLQYIHGTAIKQAYVRCKSELVRRNRFMVSTTVNVRSSEMIGKRDTSSWIADTNDMDELFALSEESGRLETTGNWYTLAKDRRGVVILIDESTSETEINIWSSIVCQHWAHALKKVLLFGDDRQLQPRNKSADREIQYNYYLKRLGISLPSRLKREGWPCFELKEQYRMHACISDFPNRMVYNGELRDGPVTHKTLEEVKPGLRAVLTDIIAEHGIEDDVERLEYQLEASDAKARLHWVEVDGKRVDDRTPWAVKEHTRVVLDQIMPKLCAYFKSRGEKTIDEVMFVVAYSYAADLYKEGIRSFRRQNPDIGIDDVPRVVTIDSSMGKEACVVIFDGSCQDQRVGFLNENARVNVAITRGSEVFWIVGGRMKFSGKKRPTNLVQKYHDELEAAGHSHHFTAPGDRAELDGNGHCSGSRGRGRGRGGAYRGGDRGRGNRGRGGRSRGPRGGGHRGGFQNRPLPMDRPQLRVEEEEFSE